MTPSKTPRGTLASIGHPKNNVLIVKGQKGWRYVDDGAVVNEEDFRAGWDILFVPLRKEN